jgi:RsmE family RNA methyltransferase
MIFQPGTPVKLGGRRHRHVIEVLRASPGDELKVGLLGGKTGTGRITKIDTASLEMEVRFDRDPPPPLPLTLILALPRPKVLRRVLFSLTVMGVKRIILINSARVEKSYWQTPFLGEAAIRKQLLLGLEQSRDTVLPEIILKKRFKPLVEDELPSLAGGTKTLIAHPGAGQDCPRDTGGPVTLAVGPEGGFVPFEIATLAACGFRPVSLGERILNVETALPAFISRMF